MVSSLRVALSLGASTACLIHCLTVVRATLQNTVKEKKNGKSFYFMYKNNHMAT